MKRLSGAGSLSRRSRGILLVASIAVVSVAVGLGVAQALGNSIGIMPTRSGMACHLNPGCPPLPYSIVVFGPATDAAIAVGFATFNMGVIAWQVIPRLRHRADPA